MALMNCATERERKLGEERKRKCLQDAFVVAPVSAGVIRLRLNKNFSVCNFCRLVPLKVYVTQVYMSLKKLYTRSIIKIPRWLPHFSYHVTRFGSSPHFPIESALLPAPITRPWPSPHRRAIIHASRCGTWKGLASSFSSYCVCSLSHIRSPDDELCPKSLVVLCQRYRQEREVFMGVIWRGLVCSHKDEREKV